MLPYGVRDKDGKFHFKMSEMTQSLDRIERVPAFHRIIAQNRLLGVSVKIDLLELKDARSRLFTPGGATDWGLYNNDYIVAFRCLMDAIHEHREKFAPLISDGDVIDFIFDEQTERKFILSFWDEYAEARSAKAKSLLGASPRFENDKICLPLQAADLWAGITRIWYEAGKPKVMQLGTSTVWSINYLSLYSMTIEYDEKSLVEGLKSSLQYKHHNPNLCDRDEWWKYVRGLIQGSSRLHVRSQNIS